MEEYLLPLVTPCAYHDPNFLPPSEADDAYAYLLANTPWEKTPKINRWVTLMELPPSKVEEAEEDRGNNNGSATTATTATTATSSGYRYRDAPGGSMIGFPPVVHALKLRAEEWYNSKKDVSSSSSEEEEEEGERVTFDVCLLNYYEDGNMRIGWHSDREEIGRMTPIASISLGATRKFLMRSRTDGVKDRTSVDMTNGSAIFMENVCQHRYLHSVPHEPGVGGGRINLTFRCKKQQQRRDARDGNGGNDGGGNGATTTTTITSGEVDHERRDNWIHKGGGRRRRTRRDDAGRRRRRRRRGSEGGVRRLRAFPRPGRLHRLRRRRVVGAIRRQNEHRRGVLLRLRDRGGAVIVYVGRCD